MLNDKIIFNRTSIIKFKNFLYNPITALVFSIVSGFYFYYISLSEKEPYYFYSTPQLIAEKANNDLKILYKDSEVKNVYLTNLILWNNGKDYIDNSDFIKSKPIKFYSIKDLKILSASINKKSRDDINFTSIIKNDTLFISLEGEEAIEQGDGVNFHILFAENSKLKTIDNPKFVLSSRVKGTKKGFEYFDVNNFNKENSSQNIFLLWGIIIVLLLFRIVILLVFKKDIVFRKKELVFFFVAITSAIYLSVKYFYFTAYIDWL